MAVSAERRAFGQFLRTEWRDTPGLIEYKFNPNHDPTNGQFTSGSTGRALRSAATAGRTRRVDPSDRQPIELGPLTAEEVATVHDLAHTRSVIEAMEKAWQDSKATGRENGLVVYYDGKRYYPGEIIPGVKGTMTDAFWNSILKADPTHGRFGVPIAVYHTHPDRYVGADSADKGDRKFGIGAKAIATVRTVHGLRVGH